MVEQDTDAVLIRRISDRASSGPAAEAELCRRFAPRIRSYGLRHFRDDDRARELVQATLVALLEAARAGRIREEQKVPHFVLATCRNIALRMREAEARAAPHALADLPELVAAEVEPLDRRALARCLGGLDERARQVVYASFAEDRTALEIAEILSTTAGNVRVLRHRAVMALRTCLEGPTP